MRKERADQLMVQQGLAESTDKAKRLIMSGKLLNENNQRIDTSGEKLPVNTQLKLKGEPLKYVSRGGYKLEKALDVFQVSVAGKIVLDIGSSTGGFTDAALQHDAAYCYALDVGTNQLAWKLRQDPRVIVMEQTNFRYSKKEDFSKGRPQLASIDVSFISLKLILPVLKDIIIENGDILALIKPQFEAAREEIGSKGIIADPKVHEHVLEDILSFAEREGYTIKGLTYSPITGGHGNVEFLAHLAWTKESKPNSSIKIEQIVAEAHQSFYSK
ncbi:TlyA family RNA methyltransferase [Pisciglobus halotolerans]|uniref:23S rRNA (Cytidine1920-2'-O)/16S rRNA (Cytidine1409-2'-O)-methyltransferase n=1 Tax=Pisciglobus halotolerans TaxID=745365 RepID=A0A1I3CWI0_9LACT|nr:TlyA family RNA methyltransferase [Pisciglobus halotolerans]SFH78797.1 23S rRNA (cytidine1920-2'-O)/16S rRNA (cytidine1409-2'-O)-methyltransferase [Pisciglobus halotolerans]